MNYHLLGSILDPINLIPMAVIGWRTRWRLVPAWAAIGGLIMTIMHDALSYIHWPDVLPIKCIAAGTTALLGRSLKALTTRKAV